MIGALLGISAALSWGGGDFAGGLASRRLPTLLVVVVSQAAALALLMPLALLFGGELPNGRDAIATAIAGIAGGSGVVLLYHGFAHGRISIVASIAGTLAALIPVAASIAAGNIPTPLRLIGFVCAMVSIVIVSATGDSSSGEHDHQSSGSAARGGAMYGLVAGLCFATFSLVFSTTTTGGTIWLLTGLRVASVAALLLLFAGAALTRRQAPGMETLRPGAIPTTMRGRLGLAALLIVAGGGDSLGNLFFLLSSQESGVAVAAVFTSVAPVTTVVFAAVLLKERVRPLQAVGIALAAIGTVAIALGGVPLS